MQKKLLSNENGVLGSGFFLAGSELYDGQWDSGAGLHNQPEKRLMMAILLDAVECFQKHAPRHQGKPDRLFRASQEWLFDDDLKWPFSFVNICDAVGIDPRYLRNGLKRWSETRVKNVNGKQSLSPTKPATTARGAVERPRSSPNAQLMSFR